MPSIIIAALLMSTNAFGADYSAYTRRPYVLSDEERQMAATSAAAQVAGDVCRETDGAYLNSRAFKNWSAQYAVRNAGRERALKAAIRQARAGVMSQVNAQGADDWCDDYLERITDTYTPMSTPVFFDDPLGYFQGPPSRSAVEVWDFFNAD